VAAFSSVTEPALATHTCVPSEEMPEGLEIPWPVMSRTKAPVAAFSSITLAAGGFAGSLPLTTQTWVPSEEMAPAKVAPPKSPPNTRGPLSPVRAAPDAPLACRSIASRAQLRR
jgi:hypothetical protein